MRWRDIKWELALILFFLVALPAGLWFYRDYTLGKRLEAELAALKAAGMPVSLAEAAPKPVPDDENAAVLYQQVFRVDFSSGGSNCLLPNFSSEQDGLVWRFVDEPSAEGEKFLRTLFSDVQTQQSLQILREASQRPHSVFPARWDQSSVTRFPHYGRFRQAARVMVARAALSAHDGDVEEALAWHKVIFRMSAHVAEEPALIAPLVAIAMQGIGVRGLRRLLSEAAIDPEATNAFEQCLRKVDMNAAFSHAMAGERAMGLDYFDMAYRDPRSFKIMTGSSHSYVYRYALPTYLGPLAGPLKKRDYLAYLEYIGELVRISRLPSGTAIPQMEALQAELEDLHVFQAPLTRMLVPMFSRLRSKCDLAVANIELCRTVLALKAYKYERGSYPASLKDLRKTLDWQLPKDPFSGQQFVYVPEEDGFILYSIGPNMIDDGGLPERDEHGKWRGDVSDIVWECVK